MMTRSPDVPPTICALVTAPASPPNESEPDAVAARWRDDENDSVMSFGLVLMKRVFDTLTAPLPAKLSENANVTSPPGGPAYGVIANEPLSVAAFMVPENATGSIHA